MESKSRLSPDLTISIISSDNLGQLLPCLRSIFATTDTTTLEVIVTDNASSASIEEKIKKEFPQVIILRNETRLGFSTNNNRALEQGKGRFFLLLNDDTVLQAEAIDILVEFMDSTPEAAAVGATLLNADGSLQASFASFPRPISEAIWPATNWSQYVLGKKTKPFQVDSVCGAAMLVRREVLDNIGLLDTEFDPIYSEEVDWCYRIKAGGGKIYMHPGAKIIHYGSQTMDKVVPQKYELLLAHKHLFFKKHHGPRSAVIYKNLLLVVTFFKYLWWSLVERVKSSNGTGESRAALHKTLLTRIRSFS